MCSKEITVCKHCEKEKKDHHIHPIKGTYHCEFGDDSKTFAVYTAEEGGVENGN